MRLFERFKLFVNRVTITVLPFAGSTLRQLVPEPCFSLRPRFEKIRRKFYFRGYC